MLKFVTMPYDHNGHMLERLCASYSIGAGIPGLTSKALPEEIIDQLVKAGSTLNATGRRISSALLDNIQSLNALNPEMQMLLQGKARLDSSSLLQELSTLTLFLSNINALIAEGATDEAATTGKGTNRVDAEWFKKLYARWESIKFLDYIGNALIISEDIVDSANMTTLDRVMRSAYSGDGPSEFVTRSVNVAHIAAFDADSAESGSLLSDPFSTLKVCWTDAGSGLSLCDPTLPFKILSCLQWAGDSKSTPVATISDTTVSSLSSILTTCHQIDSCLYALNSAPAASKWIAEPQSAAGADSNKLLRALAAEAKRLEEYLLIRFYVSMSMPVSILNASLKMLASETVISALETCYPRLISAYDVRASISSVQALPISPTLASLIKDLPTGGVMNVSGETVPLHMIPRDIENEKDAPNFINKAAAALAQIIPSLNIISRNSTLISAYMKGAALCGASSFTTQSVSLRSNSAPVSFMTYGNMKMGNGVRTLTGMQMGFTYESGLNALGGSEMTIHHLGAQDSNSGYIMPFATAHINYQEYRKKLTANLSKLKGGKKSIAIHSGLEWNRINVPTIILDKCTTETLYTSAIFDRRLLFVGPSSMLPFGTVDNRVIAASYESDIIKKEVIGEYSIPLEKMATESLRVKFAGVEDKLSADLQQMSAVLNISKVALSLMVTGDDEPSKKRAGTGAITLGSPGIGGINGRVLSRMIHPKGGGYVVCGTVSRSHFFAMPLTSLLWVPGFHITGQTTIHVVDAYVETGDDIFGAMVNSIEIPYYQRLVEGITAMSRVKQSVIGSSPSPFTASDVHRNANALMPSLTPYALPTLYEMVERDAVKSSL